MGMPKGATFPRICIYCGREFRAKSPTGKVCDDPECQAKHELISLERKRELNRQRKRGGRDATYRYEYSVREAAERRWKRSNKDLKEIIKQAEEKGMTYGQYVGWLYERDRKL